MEKKVSLNLKVARSLKDHLDIGGFDDLMPDEITDIEHWIHLIFIKDAEEMQRSEIPF